MGLGRNIRDIPTPHKKTSWQIIFFLIYFNYLLKKTQLFTWIPYPLSHTNNKQLILAHPFLIPQLIHILLYYIVRLDHTPTWFHSSRSYTLINNNIDRCTFVLVNKNYNFTLWILFFFFQLNWFNFKHRIEFDCIPFF